MCRSSWLFLCVCVGFLACRGTWVSAAYAKLNVKKHLWLCRLSAQHAFTWAQQAGFPSCLLHSKTHARPNHQCTAVPYCNSDTRHSDQSFATSTFSNPLQINFLATGMLAANDFHSAHPTPVRLLIHSSCFSWSRWCMCFVILLMCHICCIVAYTSLSSF